MADRTRWTDIFRNGLAGALVLAGLLAGPGAWGQTAFPETADLADYLAWARTHAPRVTGASAAADALTAQAEGAGALPDLKLAWGEMIVPVETRVGPQQRVFSVSQSLPWFGTLGLRREAAEAGAATAGARLTAVTLDLEQKIRAAWSTLAVAQGERVLLEDHLDLAGQIETITRAGYEAGEAQYGQVLQAEMETGRLQSRLEILAHRLAVLTVKLNTLTGLAADHPMPVASLSEAPPQTGESTLDDLLSRLAAHNPDLQALAHETESRRVAVDLAGKAGKPGLTLGVDYIMTGPALQPDLADSGKDPIIARVAVAVPLWGGRAKAEQQAAVSRLAAAQAQQTSARLDLTAHLAEAFFQVQQSRALIDLYGLTLLPRARQALVVTRADYESGRAPFAALIEARRDLLTLELDLLQARSDQRLALDGLAALLGDTAPLKGDRS